ncbi:hypothetical protein [Flavicella sp.]|uniref:hypothetical protein n=1 Tax=Flavicella sp. TaxID=2957742 RepID=UPI003017B40D
MNKIFLYISILSVFSACDLFQTTSGEKNSKLIAKVNGYVLDEEGLSLIFPENISSEDSSEVVKKLINSWVKKKLLLQKAKLNMPSQNKELELLISRYREDLYINSFKKALLAKELDTIVTNDEIRTYYEKNKVSFRVNEELVKFKYIALDPKHKKRTAYRKLFFSKSRNASFTLSEQSNDMESCFLSDSLWIRYKDVQKKLPVLINYDKNVVLQAEKFITKTYNGLIYYVYINDVIKRGEIAPLRYISKTIEQMVLQQRKLQLIHKVQEVLVKDAIKNKQLEIY